MAKGGSKRTKGKTTMKCITEPPEPVSEQQASSQGNQSVNKTWKRSQMGSNEASSLKFVTETGPKSSKIGRKESANASSVVTATFEEDGDMIDLEVRGQCTEFPSETEEGERTDSEDELMAPEQRNNNSTRNHTQVRQFSDESEDEEVTLVHQKSATGAKQQEEAEMDKFIKYMHKWGLVMVQQAPGTGMTVNVTQQQTQCEMVKTNTSSRSREGGRDGSTPARNSNERRGIETDFIDNNSIMTIYTRMQYNLPVAKGGQ